MNETISVLNKDLDQSDMKGAIAGFSDQISKSFSIIKDCTFTHEYFDIQKIIVLGMGGSAIGGDVARVIVQNACIVPIVINRSYNIPKWVDSHTLVLVSSYSGSTEETLSAFTQCRRQNCPVVILSTGGKISEYADKYGLDKIKVPEGFQPRAALGYSFSLILLLLNRLKIVKDDIITLVNNSIEPLELLSKELEKSDNASLKVAEKIHATCPIIYGSEDLTWVAALRFRGQLAENAKMLSFHHNIPEQNHNEIEGWKVNPDIMDRFSIIWLKDKEDHHRNQERMNISFALLKSFAGIQLTITQQGANRVERLLKLIHYVDWISYYVALLNNEDPTPVNRIQELKSKIAKSL